MLHGQGYRVWASARKLAALEDLAERGLQTLALDVTSDASVAAAVGRVLEAEGRIDVLVNNAGGRPLREVGNRGVWRGLWGGWRGLPLPLPLPLRTHDLLTPPDRPACRVPSPPPPPPGPQA